MDPLRPRNRAASRLPHKSWYQLKNRGPDEAVLTIYDEVIDTDGFVRDLAAVTADRLLVNISSPGGDVFSGISIYNQLRAHPAHVTTRVDGVAASIASVIVQAGDHRQMLSGAQMMVHRAWGLALGDADEMRAFGALLDRQDKILAGIYATRSGRSASHFRKLMAEETWFSDRETVAAGLADEVEDPGRVQQAADAVANEHVRFIAMSNRIDLDRT